MHAVVYDVDCRCNCAPECCKPARFVKLYLMAIAIAFAWHALHVEPASVQHCVGICHDTRLERASTQHAGHTRLSMLFCSVPSALQLLQAAAEDTLEASFGFPLFSQGAERLGWLMNMQQSCASDKETGQLTSAIDCYFMCQVQYKLDSYSRIDTTYACTDADLNSVCA